MTPPIGQRGFEDGLGDQRAVEGQPIAVDGVTVVTSRNAGSYYCAHAFFVLAQWAQRTPQAAAGFLHVPADPETTGDGAAQPDRHRRTATVVEAALRGVLEEHAAQDRVALRLLLTGYGPFHGVVDNPTGAFVSDDAQLLEVVSAAAGAPAELGAPLFDDRASLRLVHAGPLLVARLVLDVADTALDLDVTGSLPWALRAFVPQVALSMGVHRGSDTYRVELVPTDAGLQLDERAARHVPGAPMRTELPEQPLLARAIERGARALGSAGRV